MDQYPSHQQTMVKSFDQSGYSADRYIEMGNIPSNTHLECNNWQTTSTYHGAPVEPVIRYNMSESSSDGELTPKSYINGN